MTSVGIFGAGIGGMTLALACHQNGWRELTCYNTDQGVTDDFDPVSIELGPNAMRIFAALGLREQIEAIGHQPHFQQTRSGLNGYLIGQRPLGSFLAARYNAPLVIVERQRLLRCLHEALQSRDIDVRASEPIDTVSHRYDLCVACGGAQSTLLDHLGQTSVDSQTMPPSYTAWRANLPIEHPAVSALPQAITTWIGPGLCIEHCHLPAAKVLSISALSMPSQITELHQLARGWHARVQDLLADIQGVSWQVSFNAPSQRWHDHRVVLLGDAAGAITAFPSYGVALACEDAWVLSRLIASYEEELDAGLKAYQRFRRPRRQRVAQYLCSLAASLTQIDRWQRTKRNVKLALMSRYVPDLNIQKHDWWYNYNCVRGFE